MRRHRHSEKCRIDEFAPERLMMRRSRHAEHVGTSGCANSQLLQGPHAVGVNTQQIYAVFKGFGFFRRER